VSDQRSETYARLLDLAERWFGEKSYSEVSLRDLAGELGIKHASLYHHVPGGKQQLYIAVIERILRRHREGIEAAIRDTHGDIVDKMRAVAAWILTQPPFDEHRMRTQDVPHLAPEHGQALTFLAFRSFQQPVRDLLLLANAKGEIRVKNIDLAAVMFLRGIHALHAVPFQYTDTSKEQVAEEVIELLLNGWRPR
jgi:AcrR family transcriptional regulator